jgi:hypothetical protein
MLVLHLQRELRSGFVVLDYADDSATCRHGTRVGRKFVSIYRPCPNREARRIYGPLGVVRKTIDDVWERVGYGGLSVGKRS